MPTNLLVYNRGDLEDIFNPRVSNKLPDTGIKSTGINGIQDITSLFEPTNGSDQINFETGYLAISGGVLRDLRYFFQRKGYLPKYFIAPSNTIVSEGETITFNITVTDVPEGTQVCYSTSSDSDFVTPTGTVTILNAAATFDLTLKSDLTTEGLETIYVYLKDCVNNKIHTTSDAITIKDTSRTPPTYDITTLTTSANEGSAVEYTIQTTDVDDDIVLFYTTSSKEDFDNPEGSVVIKNNNASFKLNIKNDLKTEGLETFKVFLRTDSLLGSIVATSPETTIKDTSRTPATYSIAPNKTAVREGETVTFTVKTTDVDDNTVLYYVASLSEDITPSTGTITIKNSAASFVLTVKEDMLVEVNETFTVALKVTSLTGTTVQTSTTVSITTDCFKGSTKLAEVTTDPKTYTPSVFGNFSSGRYVIEYIAGAHSLWETGDDWCVGTYTLKAGSNVQQIGDSGTYTSSVVENKGREWNKNFNVFTHTGGDISLTIADAPLFDNRTHPTFGATRYAIYDYTCGNPSTYSITPEKSVVNEGDTLKVNIVTTGLPNGAVLFYNTSTDGDFDVPSGSVTVNNNTATFNLTIKRDLIAEPVETFVIYLRRGGLSGSIVATSSSITITQTAPTYSITANKTQVNEGGTVIFTIKTTEVANNTTLFYEATLDADFTNPTGTVAVINNTAQFTLNVKNDLIGEGLEIFTVKIKLNDINGVLVCTSATIDINDAPPVYAITSNKTAVVEGGSVVFTVTTTDVINGTVLYYDTTSNADFINPTGNLTINNNTGTFTLNVKSDLIGEGAEDFKVNLRTGSITGSIVRTSSSISITDATATYALTLNKTVVDEGGTVTVTVTTTDVIDGIILYYDTTSNADFITPSGSVVVNSNTGTFTLTVKNDISTEGDETFAVNLRTGSVTGSIIRTSSTCTIRDTSQAPVYAIEASPVAVSEGETVYLAVVTKNVPSGTVLYYDTSSDSDFVTPTGSVTILNDKANFTLVVKNDLTTEGEENVTVNLRTGSITGTIVRTSSSVKINDTSTTPPTYFVSSDVTSINEGGTVTFTVKTTNIANGVILYYDTTSNTDFNNPTGSVTINNNTGTFTVTAKNDLITEGAETFKGQVRKNSLVGDVVATSATITINDTSTNAPTYSITPNKTVVYEDDIVTFDIKTTNVPNNTQLFYDIPTGSNLITSTTDINICIDGTSVEAATKAVIVEMVNYGVLKRMLLPLYNNNETLYSERVQIFTTTGERTFGAEYLNRAKRAGTRVVNIAFQDESETQSSISYQHTNNANYIADIPVLKQAIANNPDNHYGIIFQVEGNSGFKTFLQGVFGGTGVFSTLNLKTTKQILPVYDVPLKANQLFYATKILDAFRTLGLIASSVFNSSDVSLTTGSVNIQNNQASFNITAINDLLPETDESFVVNLRTADTTIVRTSASVTIRDSACFKGAKIGEAVMLPKAYTVSTFGEPFSKGRYVIEYISGAFSMWPSGERWMINSVRVVEGGVVAGLGGPNDIAYLHYDDIVSTSDNIEDIGKNWFGEGQPYYKIIDHPGGYLGLVVSDNPLSDNRVHPNGACKYALYEYICGTPTYSVESSVTVNEGENITVTVKTTQVPNDTKLYFDCVGENSTTFIGDVVNPNNSSNNDTGEVTIRNNTGTFTLRTVEDFKTEGAEKFYINIRTSNNQGPIVVRGATITINDTSKARTYSLQPSVSEINEGNSVTFNVTTANVPDGTQFTYTLSRTDITPNTGTVTINNNKASFTVTANSDGNIEGYTSFTAALKSGNVTLATSNSVGIKDTSIILADYLLLTWSFTSANGRDLDIEAEVVSPEYSPVFGYWDEDNEDASSSRPVGRHWRVSSKDWGGKIFWSDDNTNYGVESVYINLTKYAAGDTVKIRTAAWWWGSRANGNMQLVVQAFKGGIMQRSGFQFYNTGGSQTGIVTHNRNISKSGKISGKGQAEQIGHVIYNKTTSELSLTI